MQQIKAATRFLLLALFFTPCAHASSNDTDFVTVLKQLSLNQKEIARVLKREIVSKKLETKDKRDAAVLGTMLLDVPAVAVTDAVRKIETFKEGKEILGIGKFNTFDPEEIKALTLDEEELSELGNCRVHSCESKMPGSWIEQLSREKDKKKRMQLFRVLLADYAKDYLARGNKAILEYDNTKRSIAAQKEFENLLKDSTYLKELAPDFHEYLRKFGESPLTGIENFVYWSREKFGFKPVINLTHVSIFKWSNAGLNGYLIASRQVYADHYYDASLGLTILIDRYPENGGAPAGSCLIYINRSRIDMLGGFLSSLRRAITLPRIISGLETHMKKMRSRVEDKENMPEPSAGDARQERRL